jgi:hypothetical protein
LRLGKQQMGQRTLAELRDDFYRNSGQVSDMLWLADWRALGAPNCAVYVVAPTDGWPCKIGISTCPRKRLSGLQTSVWKQLEVKWCGHLPSVKSAKALETKCHQTLTDRNLWLQGEWFDLRPDKAVELVQFEAMMLGLELIDAMEEGSPEWEYVSEYFRSKHGTVAGQIRKAEINHERLKLSY